MKTSEKNSKIFKQYTNNNKILMHRYPNRKKMKQKIVKLIYLLLSFKNTNISKKIYLIYIIYKGQNSEILRR